MIMLTASISVMADEIEGSAIQNDASGTQSLEITEEIPLSFTWSIPRSIDFVNGIAEAKGLFCSYTTRKNSSYICYF